MFIRRLLFLLIVLLAQAGTNTGAQQYSMSECSLIKPQQVIIDNYSLVLLPQDIAENSLLNRFDETNPYTYLQLLNDAAANRYHVLFQTDFMGKILFVAYSNNLSAIFNKKEKPMFLFMRCIKDINRHISPVQVKEAVINCLLDRLNYCYGN